MTEPTRETLNDLYQVKIKDVERITQIFYHTFQEDPKFNSFFVDEISTKKGMPALIRFLVKSSILEGQCYAISEKLEGIALWQESFSGFSFTQAVKSGLFDLIKSFSFRSLLRLFASYKKIEKFQKVIYPKKYMGLELLGVGVNYQKQGYAGVLLRSMFNHLDSINLPCCLMTNTEVNVRIYKKYSFALAGSYLNEKTKVYSYYMIREPRVQN